MRPNRISDFSYLPCCIGKFVSFRVGAEGWQDRPAQRMTVGVHDMSFQSVPLFVYYLELKALGKQQMQRVAVSEVLLICSKKGAQWDHPPPGGLTVFMGD